MSKVFIFDYKKCNGCHNCQISCKDEHCDQAWLPYAEAQPLTGQFWCKVDETVRGQVPVVKIAYKAHLGGQSIRKLIAETYPEVVEVREDGIVLLDPAKAAGRKDIADAFPGDVFWNESLELPQMCTGCAHLLDNGWTVPRCVDSCATDALRFGEEADFGDELAECVQLVEGSGIYYKNVPKRFIAGAVVDLEADELVVGVRVELFNGKNELVAAQDTDEFGDFFFDQVEAAVYVVSYAGKNVPADVTEEDLCLGDLAI